MAISSPIMVLPLVTVLAPTRRQMPRIACRASAAVRAERIRAFDGTQPTLRQSPPRRCRSASATRAPNPAAPTALTSPAVPAPTTTRS